MRRALITGGSGFVGRHLIRSLQSRGFQLAVLASGEFEKISDVASYEVDIRDAERVRSAIRDFRPDHVYHLAAISSVGLSWKSPRLTYEVNVFGTLNVIEAAMSLPAPPMILNVSTAQVYARSWTALTESSPLGPDNPYAASKAMAEWLSVQYRAHSDVKVITARSFNHAGPGQSTDYVLSSIAKQFAEIEARLREPKLVLGNIHVQRDFTDVRDVIGAYCLLLEKGIAYETYNVCSGRAWSIGEVVEKFQSISGVLIDVEVDFAKLRPDENELVCGDHQKIRAATGWAPAIPLHTTLEDMLNYWRAAIRKQSTETSELEHSARSLHLQEK
ncbi:MAG TPA: GDP-mannose 4,6-dehydratase [Terriglobales bacterium]|nr:GDP-mannose 4,6-dehydratase [Terriglobales bacterium]